MLAELVFAAAAASLPQLEVTGTFPVQGDAGIQPSGLAYCQNKLLMVSDEDDLGWYQLVVGGEVATASRAGTVGLVTNEDEGAQPSSWATISTLQSWFIKTYDFEGVTCGEDGKILLLSEAWSDVLEVSGKSATWRQTKSHESAERAGMMPKHNAGYEGIAADGSTLILAAERQARGLVTVDAAGKVVAKTLPDSPNALNDNPNDIADMTIFDRHLYTLERNQHRVCRRQMDGTLQQCWAFDQVLLSDANRYVDNQFGLAEGLSIFDGSIWIVVDNNGSGLVSKVDDTRPRLYRFRLPN